jgi:hypothetical protein
MAIPRTSIRSFLSQAKQALHAATHDSHNKVTLVIGNESAGSSPPQCSLRVKA